MLYDPQQHEPLGDYSLIPPGLYRAVIMDTAWKRNAAGTGHYLKLQFEIQDGAQAGRYLWANLNLDHPNETAVKIAGRELRSICDALGIRDAFDPTSDSGQYLLLNKRLILDVGIWKRKDNGEEENRIRGYQEGGVAAPKASDRAPMPTGKSADEDEDDLPF